LVDVGHIQDPWLLAFDSYGYEPNLWVDLGSRFNDRFNDVCSYSVKIYFLNCTKSTVPPKKNPPLMKHALLENPPSSSMKFPANETFFSGDFPLPRLITLEGISPNIQALLVQY